MNEYRVQPCDLTADQRRRKIAAILAAGVLRLRARAALTTPVTGPENQTNSV